MREGKVAANEIGFMNGAGGAYVGSLWPESIYIFLFANRRATIATFTLARIPGIER